MSGANSLDLDTIFLGSEPMADEIGNKWLEWKGARDTAELRWKETTQYVYATSTRETNNANIGGFAEDASEDAGWSHSTHVPKITQISDNLSATYMSAVMPHDDFFKYQGLDEEASAKEVRRMIEAYLKTKHRNSKFRSVLQRIVDDFVLYGNCFATVYFTAEKIEVTVGDDTFKNGYVGPKVERISPYDIVFNPLATSFESSPKIIRTLKTIGELHRDVEENPSLKYDQEMLNMVMKMRGEVQNIDADTFDKHCQLQFDGFGTASQYFQSGFVEILEFYGDMYDLTNQKFYKNYVITVIDKKYVIRREPLQTWTGRPLIFHAGWRTRPDNLWAMGPLDNLVGMQYLINHLENARADAFDQMLAPTRVLVGDVERYNVAPGVPGGEYRIPSGEGSVSNLLPDTTVLTADIQIERKMFQMEEFAGSPKQEMGIRTPGEKTLGEVQHLHRAASKVFKNKIIQLESFVEDILNAELEVARSYPHMEDLISVVGEDGIQEFMEIKRDDLKSNGKLIPIGSRFFERQQQLVNNFQLLQQALMQDELALQHFSSIKLAKMYEELMDMDQAGIVQPFVRVGEQAQLMKFQLAAQTQMESEDQIDVGGEDEEVAEAESELGGA